MAQIRRDVQTPRLDAMALASSTTFIGDPPPRIMA
jgi:hypothetical protein